MKKIWMIGSVAACLILVAGILAWKLLAFPAEEYGMAVLDAMYKEKFDVYQELTAASEKELQERYDEEIKKEADIFKKYFGITKLSADGEKKLTDFVKNVNSYLKYEVTNSEKKGENRVITIKVTPLAMYKIIDREACMDTFRKKAENREYWTLDDTQYQTAFAEFVMKEYETALEKGAVYGSAKEYELTLMKTGSTYVPSDEEFSKICGQLIAYEK